MSTLDLAWIIPVMILMLLLKGFFSGSEIALVNADKIKLSHRAKQGNRGAHRVVQLFKRPEKLLTTTLIGTNISTVVLTTLGTLMFIHFFGNRWGDLYAFVFFTPLLLILGEIVPKSIYQQESDRIAPIVVFPLSAFAWIFAPIVYLFSRIARGAAWLAGGGATSHHLFITRDQLRSVIEMADRASDTTVFDRFRIERAIRFSETTVGEEMIPVADMVAIDNEKTTNDAIQLVRRRGFHRLPAYQGDTNNVVGIVTLSAWDLLDPDTTAKPLSQLIQPAHYVSPHDPLEEVLPTLRDREDKMAIVVDEYGSTIGMITMEDLVEAVVGDIDVGNGGAEPSSRQARRCQKLSEDSYLMDGRLTIHEANDVLGLNLPATEFHTVGGMLVARLHHLAKPGESVVEGGYRFTVEEASETSVRSVKVTRESFGEAD